MTATPPPFFFLGEGYPPPHVPGQQGGTPAPPFEKMSGRGWINGIYSLMWQCDAEKSGVDRKTFQRIKTRIRKFGEINITTGAVRRLLAMC